jgi:alkanesulfonate monooxygenase SsuD/methylene tetrahydromethanopterin reductase-like flavin-dependent oxidoreductase (luciferase family)
VTEFKHHTMNTGLIHVPYSKPGTSARATFDWAVQTAIACDRAGFTEMMIAEHATQAWENIPNPELVIAAAARETEQIKFAPMAHLLPYHNPASLAIQVGWLSQILKGRYFLGIGAGAYRNDAILRGLSGEMLDAHAVEAPAMVAEAFEIMQRVWKREPFHFVGKYFKAGFPEEPKHDPSSHDEQHVLADYSPWGGKLDVACTGLSRNSPSMKFAGANGLIPVSIYSGASVLKTHWETYEKAAHAAGRVADRTKYHVSQNIFVAETDKEARKWAKEGGLGQCWQKYLWPIYERFGLLQGFIEDAGATKADVDFDWIIDNCCVVGSPDTVVEKLNRLFEFTGGWGTLQVQSFDYSDNPEPWFESLNLIVKEVAPRVKMPASTTH